MSGQSLEGGGARGGRLYPEVRLDMDGDRGQCRVERQDLDEMLGNLIENAAKYGGGSVFVTVKAATLMGESVPWIEDDGRAFPRRTRAHFRSRRAARYRQARHRPRPRDRARCGGDLSRHRWSCWRARIWAACWYA
jgi:signal transduction histidine kinase